MLLTSSFLTHYILTSKSRRYKHPRQFRGNRSRSWWEIFPNLDAVLPLVAIGLRRVAKLLAAVNAIWIVVTCIFQFGNFFDRCYCNSSVIGRGKSAFNVVKLMSADVPPMRNAWITGVCVAGGAAVLFVLFVHVFIDPPLPDSKDKD